MTSKEIAKKIIEWERYDMQETPIENGAALIDEFKAAAIRKAFEAFYEKYLSMGMKYVDGADIDEFLKNYLNK
jgi:hypothetical protein